MAQCDHKLNRQTGSAPFARETSRHWDGSDHGSQCVRPAPGGPLVWRAVDRRAGTGTARWRCHRSPTDEAEAKRELHPGWPFAGIGLLDHLAAGCMGVQQMGMAEPFSELSLSWKSGLRSKP